MFSSSSLPHQLKCPCDDVLGILCVCVLMAHTNMDKCFPRETVSHFIQLLHYLMYDSDRDKKNKKNIIL